MHITASVFINDDEVGLHHDFERFLEKLAPEKPYNQYEHNGFEDNADAHLKRQIMGREVVVAITEGKLDFGPWERIFYGEFDGMRKKRILEKLSANKLINTQIELGFSDIVGFFAWIEDSGNTNKIHIKVIAGRCVF